MAGKEEAMRRTLIGLLTLMLLWAHSTNAQPQFPRFSTLKLVIEGPGLMPAMEIAEPSVVENFSVWTGPGARVFRSGDFAFIDWSEEALAEVPADLNQYEVSFYVERRVHNKYVVIYGFAPSEPGGYIYLPGRGEEHASGNTWLVYHRVEGNWFPSSSAWERLVRPLIEERLDR
jgi:hypothetical protein